MARGRGSAVIRAGAGWRRSPDLRDHPVRDDRALGDRRSASSSETDEDVRAALLDAAVGVEVRVPPGPHAFAGCPVVLAEVHDVRDPASVAVRGGEWVVRHESGRPGPCLRLPAGAGQCLAEDLSVRLVRAGDDTRAGGVGSAHAMRSDAYRGTPVEGDGLDEPKGSSSCRRQRVGTPRVGHQELADTVVARKGEQRLVGRSAELASDRVVEHLHREREDDVRTLLRV